MPNRYLQRQPKLNLDRPFHLLHILVGDAPGTILKPLLVYRGNLIGHSLVFCVVQSNNHLTWIAFAGIAGKGDDLNTIEMVIGGVVADNDSRSDLSDFRTDRGFEIYPPDVTSFHR